MSLKVVSLFRSFPWSRDWTNQELAEFYRVEASLVRAQIPIETDRGRSDEGDPWFVFCHAETGDVIIHFARIDGIYIVASPALRNCSHGRDFRALIEAQIQSHPQVIPKTHNGKIFVHPAALLIVLVASCFVKLAHTSAVASELNQPHSSPSGIGDSKFSHSGSAQRQLIVLDERAAAAVLAAMAVAAVWAQSDNANLWLLPSASTTKAIFSSRDISDVASMMGVHTADDSQVGAFHSHNLAGGAGPLDFGGTGQSLAATPLMRTPTLSNHSYSDTQSAGIDSLPMHPDHVQPMGSAPASPDGVLCLAVFHPLQESIIFANNINGLGSTFAAQEVIGLVGQSLSVHLATASDEAQQRLVLHATLAPASGSGHENDPLPTEAPVPTPVISSTPAAAASDAPVPSSAVGSANSPHAGVNLAPPSDAPTSAVSSSGSLANNLPATSAPSNNSQLGIADIALQTFIINHADFKIIDLQNEIIVYDAHLTTTNLSSATQETFGFNDGSSIVLVGLPTPEVTSQVTAHALV